MIKKVALFSLLTATLYVTWLKIIVVLGISSIQIPMLPLIVNTLLIAVPLYAGLMYIRKTQYENEMNFSQSFYVGILMSVISAAFVFVILATFESMGILIPSLLADYKNSSEVYANTLPAQEMKAFNAQIDAALKQPYNVAKQNLVMVLLISAFSSTIISLFVRNKNTFNEIK